MLCALNCAPSMLCRHQVPHELIEWQPSYAQHGNTPPPPPPQPHPTPLNCLLLRLSLQRQPFSNASWPLAQQLLMLTLMMARRRRMWC